MKRYFAPNIDGDYAFAGKYWLDLYGKKGKYIVVVEGKKSYLLFSNGCNEHYSDYVDIEEYQKNWIEIKNIPWKLKKKNVG